MIKRLIEKLNGNFANTVLPAVFFVVFAIVAQFTFNYCTNGKKHINGTDIDWWEKWITVIFLGVIGFCIGKLFTVSDDGNDGGGGDYFDCTGGAGGIM